AMIVVIVTPGTGGGNTGGGTPTPSPSNVLHGGAGSVQEYKLLGSPSNNQEVGEDQNDVKVLGFSVEADDSSDINVNAVRISFLDEVLNLASSSSDNFDDYADNVSIWYG